MAAHSNIAAGALIAAIIFTSAIWNVARWNIGPFNVNLTDVAFLVVTPVALASLILQWPTSLNTHRKLIVVLSLATLWVLISSFHSPDVGGGLRSVGQVVRNSLIVIAVIYSSPTLPIKSIARSVFYSLAAVHLITLAIYAIDMIDYIRTDSRESILVTSGIFDREQIFEITRAWVPVFEGFAFDPNTLGIYLPIGLICGIYLKEKSRRMWLLKWAGIGVLSTSLTLTLSRGMWAAFLLSVLVFLVVAAWTRRGHIAIPALRFISTMIAVALFLLVIGQLLLPANTFSENRSAWGFVERKFRAENFDWNSGGRLDTQLEVLPDNFGGWAIGGGARTSRYITGGRYAENSYTGLISDFGLIGLLIFLSPFIYAIQAAFREALKQNGAADDLVMPWLFILVVILFQGLYISLTFQPFVWVIAAVAMVGVMQARSKLGRTDSDQTRLEN